MTAPAIAPIVYACSTDRFTNPPHAFGVRPIKFDTSVRLCVAILSQHAHPAKVRAAAILGVDVTGIEVERLEGVDACSLNVLRFLLKQGTTPETKILAAAGPDFHVRRQCLAQLKDLGLVASRPHFKGPGYTPESWSIVPERVGEWPKGSVRP